MTGETCVRCDDDADHKVRYNFVDGKGYYWYCRPCAVEMHEIYGIDKVIIGDLDV